MSRYPETFDKSILPLGLCIVYVVPCGFLIDAIHANFVFTYLLGHKHKDYSSNIIDSTKDQDY